MSSRNCPPEELAALPQDRLPAFSATDTRPVHIAPEDDDDPARAAGARGRIPPRLDLCRSCHEYVWPHETDCPHCGADIAAAARAYATRLAEVQALAARIRARLDEAATGI